MIVKVSKLIWFFSLMGFTASFMYTYASLPDRVILWPGDAALVISKNTFFYIVVFAIATVNALVFVVNTLFKSQTEFRAWFFAQMVTLNFFFTVVLMVVSRFNTGENLIYDRVGIVLYGSIGLILLCLLIWPVRYFLRNVKY